MNDWGRSVLCQYGMEFDNVKRGKGILLCSAGGGTYCLQPFKGNEKRLYEEAALLDYLHEKGHMVDCVIKNAQGSYVSRNEYQDPFTLRLWHPGDECLSDDTKMLKRALEKLARLHLDMRNVPEFLVPVFEADEKKYHNDSLEDYLRGGEDDGVGTDEVQPVRHCIENCEDMFERRLREMKKIQSFVKKRKSKTSFEEQILSSAPQHMEQAMEACVRLNRAGYGKRLEDAVMNRHFIHGTYNYHFVYMQKDAETVVNFSKYALQEQLIDLYEFLRKAMEKNDWSEKLGNELLDAYSAVIPLKANDLQILCALLTYPDKYWKQLNAYYSSNKVWIPPRNQEKLDMALKQNVLRKKFAESLAD